MRVTLPRFVCCALALVLTIGHAGAQNTHDPEFPDQPLDAEPCQVYAAYWAQVTDIARQRGCLPSGDAWTSDVSEQMKVCNGSYDNVLVKIADRNKQMQIVTAGNCGACSVIADSQLKYALGNQLYQCKFSADPNAPLFYRWSTDRAQQVDACLGQFNSHLGGSPPDIVAVRQEFTTAIAEMRAQIEQCKLTHQPQGCLFAGCHSTNSSSAVLIMPKSEKALQDAFKPFPSRTKPRAAAVEDPCKSPGRSSSSPCKQSPTRVKEGGGSAMDRLGDLNNNLGTVSGNAGGAQIGRTPSPTSPTTSAPANAGAVEPARSNPSVFISKPSPTFNNSNTIR